MAARPTNADLCDAFRDLLTRGFYVVDADGVVNETCETSLAATKPWRGDVWKAFRELEERLCPVQARTRRLTTT